MNFGRLAVLLVVAALAACSDDKPAPGLPLAQASELVIIAHQGDELLYMGNDVVGAIGTTPVTTVVITNGTSELESDPVEADQARGIKAAYAFLAGASVDAWECGPITVHDHPVRHCRLADARLSLVFLDLRAAAHDGSGIQTLLGLWEATSPTIAPVTDAKATYDQADLIATVSAIVEASAPANLRTLEIAATHGNDHADHMLVGALAWLALAAAPVDKPKIFAYRGDNAISGNPNVTLTDRAENAIEYYDACILGCGTCGQKPCTPQAVAGDLFTAQHSHPILAQVQTTGAFQIGAQCASFPTGVGDNGTLVDCQASPPSFIYHPSDLIIRDAAGCVRSLFTAELVQDDQCAAKDPGVHFLYDEEGHLWFGVPPAPAAGMSFAHLVCMDQAGGRPRGTLCGASHDVTVTLGAPTP